MVRVWNPAQEARPVRGNAEDLPRGDMLGEEPSAAEVETCRLPRPARWRACAASRRVARTRQVWDNPMIWREIRTWAYGRKTLVIRLAYLALFGLCRRQPVRDDRSQPVGRRQRRRAGLVPLFLLSLVLVNAQAVTSMTSERDARALDLLLVTDLSPKEIVFGKLGGVFYNTKEMVLLPRCCAASVPGRVAGGELHRSGEPGLSGTGWSCCTFSPPCWAFTRA